MLHRPLFLGCFSCLSDILCLSEDLFLWALNPDGYVVGEKKCAFIKFSQRKEFETRKRRAGDTDSTAQRFVMGRAPLALLPGLRGMSSASGDNATGVCVALDDDPPISAPAALSTDAQLGIWNGRRPRYALFVLVDPSDTKRHPFLDRLNARS